MKKLIFITIVFLMSGICCLAEEKPECQISINGTPFTLFGKVKLVDIGEDLKVKIVDISPDRCGKVKLVDIGEDLKVKLVDIGEDLKVKIVDIGEGITH